MTHLLARCVTAITILTVLAIPRPLAAAQPTPRYVAIDLGTFGGPNGYLDLQGRPMNARGTVIGSADTTTPDPYAPNCVTPDCLDVLGFEWHNGVVTRLASLGGFNDAPFAINDAGVIAGVSYTSVLDPATGFPESRAVVWKDGGIRNLGTPPGGTESFALGMNNRGQIMGAWSNGIASPYSCQFFNCWGVETRGFVWQNGVMEDLGTLGGRETLPVYINNRGQIAGQSYTNTTPSPTTGQPKVDVFLWQNGRMQDLGDLGGTFSTTGGFTDGLNSRGQVVGSSDLPGDQSHHPNLWDGNRLLDLGTLGGDSGEANGVSEAGQVVGTADLPGDQIRHAFLWKNGHMTDLLPLPGAPCSNGVDLNNRGQAVGTSSNCHGASRVATLWEGGSAFDLNTLIGQSPFHLEGPLSISDRGEILAGGHFPNGDVHIILLVPTSVAGSVKLGTMADGEPVSATQQAATAARSLPDTRTILDPASTAASASFTHRMPILSGR